MKANLDSKWLYAIAFLALTSIANTASASCTATGKIGRTYSNVSGANDYTYYYIAPETSSPYGSTLTYYVRIEGFDEGINNAMSAAFAANHTVQCNGTTATCPTTGSYRYMGSANYCYAYRHK